MRLFDKKFKGHEKQYIVQSVLAGLAAAAVLCMFDIVDHPAIVASFGASCFIAFTIPHNEYSRPKRLIGGYAIGIASGCVMHYLTVIPLHGHLALMSIHVLAGGLAVVAAMFFMAITETEHAPAAGIALGFAINEYWSVITIVKVLVGIALIAGIKTALKPKMFDLT